MTESNLDRVRRYYDDFSATYDDARAHGYHRMIDELETELAIPYARGASVLELGCGTGLILERVARVAREAVGVDISNQMAARAIARGLDVRIGDLRDLPFEDARFDLTYGFKVLAHVPELERAIAEAARVTRPGGHVVIELYNRWSLRYLATKLAGPRQTGASHSEADVYTRWDSPAAIRSLARGELGLVDVFGVRVLTPFAAAHRVPGVASALARAEALAARSPARWFGGFLVAVLRKR